MGPLLSKIRLLVDEHYDTLIVDLVTKMATQ